MAATVSHNPKSTPRRPRRRHARRVVPSIALLRENRIDLRLALDDLIDVFDPRDPRHVERLADLSEAYRLTIARLARHERHEAGR